jgi:hypothetical protein
LQLHHASVLTLALTICEQWFGISWCMCHYPFILRLGGPWIPSTTAFNRFTSGRIQSSDTQHLPSWLKLVTYEISFKINCL